MYSTVTQNTGRWCLVAGCVVSSTQTGSLLNTLASLIRYLSLLQKNKQEIPQIWHPKFVPYISTQKMVSATVTTKTGITLSVSLAVRVFVDSRGLTSQRSVHFAYKLQK